MLLPQASSPSQRLLKRLGNVRTGGGKGQDHRKKGSVAKDGPSTLTTLKTRASQWELRNAIARILSHGGLRGGLKIIHGTLLRLVWGTQVGGL